MRFDIEIQDTDCPNLLRTLLAITGEEPWGRKFEVLQFQAKQNPFIQQYQVEHHGVELKLFHLLAQQRRNGIFPMNLQDGYQYELYSFAAAVTRIYAQLSDRGQTRVRGMLMDGLKPDNNLLGLQHEMTTAVHLVARGYDVDMNDIERGGFDFLASRGGAEVEVECKMFSGDLGKKIHRRKALAVHQHLAETIQRAYNKSQQGLIVCITVPDRLTCSLGQLAGLEKAVSLAIVSGKDTYRTSDCEVAVTDFDITKSPFNVAKPDDLLRAEIAGFVQEKIGRTNQEMMLLFSPGKRVVIAVLESAASDAVLDGVYRQLKSAAKQLTGTRPGIITAQFHNLTAEELMELGKADSTSHENASGLQRVTSRFLNRPNKQHIHTVCYRSHSQLVRQGNVTSGGGPSYYFLNHDNPYFQDSRVNAFG